MAERFQVKKLNKEDHKKMDKTVEGIKKGSAILAGVGAVTTGLVKYGKPIFNGLKKMIFK